MMNIWMAGLLAFLQMPIGLVLLLTKCDHKDLAKLINPYFNRLLLIVDWFLVPDPITPNGEILPLLFVRSRSRLQKIFLNFPLKFFF